MPKGRPGIPRKTRWERISGMLERHAGEDGWIAWYEFVQRMGKLNVAQIKATLRDHRDDIEVRKVPRAGNRASGRKKFEIRLKRDRT